MLNANAASAKKNILIINEDDSHFYASGFKMNVQGILEYVDRFKDTKVSHFFMCPNAQRAAFKSKCRQAIWEPVISAKATPEEVAKNIFFTAVQGEDFTKRFSWPRNAKILNDMGLDPYKIWIARCREIGISP